MHELAQQKRVPGRHLPAGRAERLVGIGSEYLPQESGGRLAAQQRRPNNGRHRIGDDPRQQTGILGRLVWAQPDDDEHAEPLHSWQQVGEEAQRRQVAPVQIVEREQERPARGEVRRQPVEAVQRRQRRIRRRLDRHLCGIEKRRRQRGGAAQRLGSLLRLEGSKQRLVELPHDPVGERALELRAARAEREQARLLRQRLRPRNKGRLADTRRPLDRQQPATLGDSGDQLGHRGELVLALQQLAL